MTDGSCVVSKPPRNSVLDQATERHATHAIALRVYDGQLFLRSPSPSKRKPGSDGDQ